MGECDESVAKVLLRDLTLHNESALIVLLGHPAILNHRDQVSVAGRSGDTEIVGRVSGLFVHLLLEDSVSDLNLTFFERSVLLLRQSIVFGKGALDRVDLLLKSNLSIDDILDECLLSVVELIKGLVRVDFQVFNHHINIFLVVL